MSKKNNVTMYKVSEMENLFNMVKDPKTGKVVICIGNYKVTNQNFNTYEEAENYIASKPYELIINTCVLFLKFSNNENNEKSAKDTKNNL